MTNENEIPDFDIEDSQRVEFNPVAEEEWENQPIVFYCQDCQKIVKEKQVGKSLKFVCSECNGDHISYGTEKSIKNYFHISSEE